MESLIAQDVAERHDEALRASAVMRQVRGPRHARVPAVRHRLARRLVAFAGRLDPQAPVVELRPPDAAPRAGASAPRSRRAA